MLSNIDTLAHCASSVAKAASEMQINGGVCVETMAEWCMCWRKLCEAEAAFVASVIGGPL